MVHRHLGVQSDAELQAAFRAVLKAAMAAADRCTVKHHDASTVVLAKMKVMDNAAFLQSIGIKVNRDIEFDEEWRTETSQGAATTMLMSARVDLGICSLAVSTAFARVALATGKTYLEVRSKVSVVGAKIDPIMRSVLVSQAQAQFKKDRALEAAHIAEAMLALRHTA